MNGSCGLIDMKLYPTRMAGSDVRNGTLLRVHIRHVFAPGSQLAAICRETPGAAIIYANSRERCGGKRQSLLKEATKNPALADDKARARLPPDSFAGSK